MGISGLNVLPDRQLPSVDSALIGWLEHARTAEEYGKTMDRIERFATSRIVTRAGAYTNGSRERVAAPSPPRPLLTSSASTLPVHGPN
jgi:hypothetical protein